MNLNLFEIHLKQDRYARMANQVCADLFSGTVASHRVAGLGQTGTTPLSQTGTKGSTLSQIVNTGSTLSQTGTPPVSSH